MMRAMGLDNVEAPPLDGVLATGVGVLAVFESFADGGGVPQRGGHGGHGRQGGHAVARHDAHAAGRARGHGTRGTGESAGAAAVLELTRVVDARVVGDLEGVCAWWVVGGRGPAEGISSAGRCFDVSIASWA
jgi:hypothetical protein